MNNTAMNHNSGKRSSLIGSSLKNKSKLVGNGANFDINPSTDRSKRYKLNGEPTHPESWYKQNYFSRTAEEIQEEVKQEKQTMFITTLAFFLTVSVVLNIGLWFLIVKLRDTMLFM